MGQRVDLHELLIETAGTENVYFQPPESIKLKYPCIIYKRSRNSVRNADNRVFFSMRSYSGLYITRDADTDIPDQLETLPYCSLENPYTTDNLYHYPFTIYY